MTPDKNRRVLLEGATVLGLSLGISAVNITKAEAAGYIKIGDIQGEAKSQQNTKWVEAEIIGKKLMLKSNKGKVSRAIQGTFTLRDGTVIVVKDGLIIR
ncbi:MAG: hypothetical protein ACI9ZD_001143 [Paracoccaceae bacterium]|jgi:hypothetical protein